MTTENKSKKQEAEALAVGDLVAPIHGTCWPLAQEHGKGVVPAGMQPREIVRVRTWGKSRVLTLEGLAGIFEGAKFQKVAAVE